MPKFRDKPETILTSRAPGCYSATQLTAEDAPPIPIAGHVDVFGLPVVTHTGLPSLKVVPQIECPNCSSRTLAASRWDRGALQ